MKVFVAIFIFLLIILTAIMLVAFYYVRKGIRFFRRFSSGDMDEEEFKRMSDKYYSSKKRNDVHFDDDYFKGKGWQRNSSKQAQKKQRTTRTADGVTIVDNRDPDANKKIFAQDEGEYVDYIEN